MELVTSVVLMFIMFMLVAFSLILIMMAKLAATRPRIVGMDWWLSRWTTQVTGHGLGDSVNGSTPKWMVFVMERRTKIDDFGDTRISGNHHIVNVFIIFLMEL